MAQDLSGAAQACMAATEAIFDELFGPAEFDFDQPIQGEVPQEHLLLRIPPTGQDVPELGERLSVPVIDGDELAGHTTGVVAALQEREVEGVKVLLIALEPDRESETQPQSGAAAAK